jgi:HAD superfamily hydrolase (TIGR01509 family)
MEYKAVLFDMNGVIVDDEPLHLLAFQKVLADRGEKLSRDGYKRYFAGKTDVDGFRAYLAYNKLDLDVESLMAEKAQAYMAQAEGVIQPYPGVVEFIRSMASDSTRLALVTSSLRVEATTVLKAFDLEGLFEVEVTADDITQGKPNPEGYLKGAAALSVAPADCVVIEDAPSGVKAAKAAGMRCVVVLNTHTEAELNGADLKLVRLAPGCLAQKKIDQMVS